MSISYRIDRDLGIVVSTWEGDITPQDLVDHFLTLLSDEDAMAVGRSLGDLRKANLLFTGGELRKIIESIVRPRLGERRWKVALLVGSSLQYGVARQYQVFAEAISHDSIFEEKDSALLWLLDTDS